MGVFEPVAELLIRAVAQSEEVRCPNHRQPPQLLQLDLLRVVHLKYFIYLMVEYLFPSPRLVLFFASSVFV